MSTMLGSLHKVDCESLNSVVAQYDKALEENFTKRGQFEKFRDDYVKLRARLKTLPEKLEYDAMVPICSKAICPGKIIHTNEILVLLGENTFVECTAKKASQIITHRLKNIDETLNRLDKERELYNSWKLEAERQMVETLGEGTIEIVEDYDAVLEQEWRKGHRESVRKYHQDLGRARAASLSSSCVNNVGKTAEEEKLWTRLDALELEEEFMEAQAIYEERNTTNNETTGDNKCTVKIRERTRASKLNLPEFQVQQDNKDMDPTFASSGKKVTFSPDNIIHNLTDLSARDYKKKGKEGPNTNSTLLEAGNDSNKALEEVVELYKPSESEDNGLYDPIFIRFRHDPLPDNGERVGSEESDSEDEDEDDADYQIVLSPGDIFEQFGPPSLEAKSVPGADKTPLKSILKPRGVEKKISHRDLCTTANVVKKGLVVEPTEVITAEVKERVPVPKMPDSSGVNDISSQKPNHPNDIQLQPSAPPVLKDNKDEKDLFSGANTINLSIDNNSSSTNRPVSLFKRMQSQERALSSDTNSTK